jgi:hypothetical protein
MSSVNFASLGSVVAAMAEPTPKAAAMQTISAYAFEVRIRFIVMSFLVLVWLILTR